MADRQMATTPAAQPSPGGQGDALHDAVGRIFGCDGSPWRTRDVAAVLLDYAALTARQPVDEVSVKKDDANNYCLILRALGMEEEGDPVAEVKALIEARDRQPVGEPVAWMTHHDEPMLFPTSAEAAAYCEDDEQPVPLFRSPAQAVDLGPTFQDGVADWMGQCFLPSLYSNMTERGDRLLEEVLELLQAHGYDRARVPTLVDYVFGRPVGEPVQEVGGVMVTLAGYCGVAGIDMHAAGDAELARINQPDVMAKIRAKQEAKNALHFDTPLPGNAARQPVGEPITVEAVAEIFNHPEYGLSLNWLLENGIGELQAGDVLMVSDRAITDEDGSGEVYTAPPAHAVDLEELRLAVCVVNVVGQIDGHDVVRRNSVLDVIDTRRQRLADSQAVGNGQPELPA